MSQNGVKFLANAGHCYREIIAHFFPGASLTKLE
jgi:peptidoglycan hydrolase-like amidase